MIQVSLAVMALLQALVVGPETHVHQGEGPNRETTVHVHFGVESLIKTWFTALSDQDKQLFLATSGANLTAFARQATRLGELRGMNEIHHHIYQAFKAISAGQLTFSANELWEGLDSVAKEYRLDMVLHQVFGNVQMLMETVHSSR